MRTNKRTFPGVTMLELLIVMAIIALLLSIVLPALPYGRGEAVKAQCRNNLRQIMTVATVYAYGDPQTIVGPVHPRSHEFIGEGYAEYGGGPGSMSYMGWGQEFDPRTRPLNHSMYGKAGVVSTGGPGQCPQFEVFRCPGDDLGWQTWPGFGTDPRETENPYFVAYGTSFRMNNMPYADGSSVGIYGRSITRIPEPGLTLAFMEARVFQTLFTNDAWGSLTHGELTSYHGLLGYFNVAYVDGHADFVDFGDGTYYQHSDPTEMDVRGTWGRMDCFPEPPLDPGRGLTSMQSPPPGGGARPVMTMSSRPGRGDERPGG